MTKYSSIDDMLQNWSIGNAMDPATLAQMRGDSISDGEGAGRIYLTQNADAYECTVKGDQIKDKDGKVLSPEDDTYQKIVRMAKLQASKDDTILRELFD